MDIQDSISAIRANLPCSVELPAGCGKTELITHLVREHAREGRHCLVLTHTHAGVDALRRRFRRLKVPSRSVTVRTVDSWCFDLISSFPQLADIEVGDEPDWGESRNYHVGGASAVDTDAVRRMLVASYDLMVVDEYQDCQQWQHGLICAMAQSVPTAVFGDRLQGIFFFADNEPVLWESDVLAAFPPVEVAIDAWRWKPHNPALGAWLLDVRERLMRGAEINLATGPLSLVAPARLNNACYAQPTHPMRTVAIAKWPHDCAALARRLGGNSRFTMIEEMDGKFLLTFAKAVDAGGAPNVAKATVDFAVGCAFGVATPFDAAARRRLVAGHPLTGVRFACVPEQVAAVDALLSDASPRAVGDALRSLGRLDSFRLYRREAWNGVLDALRIADASDDLSVADAVVQTRNRLRLIGRYPESRILARPLLIKGLEFDYAIVTDPSAYNAHELYVCLTRASRGLAVVSAQARISPTRPTG